jgi:hypothetical protein
MNRFTLRFKDTRLVPTVEALVPSVVKINPYTVHYEPVKRFRGFTRAHAFGRAVQWTRQHGDPR